MKNLILFLIFSCLFTVSCKKDDNNNNNNNNNNNTLPVANFSIYSPSYYAPCNVTFTNQSTDATSFSWDFGDGASNTVSEPNHTYSSAGNFNVTLTATNQYGNNSISKTVNVYAHPPTNVKIVSVTMNYCPPLNPVGSVWDYGSDPDVFFNIQSQSDGGTVYRDGTTGRYTDMPQSVLPYTFNLPSAFVITNLNTQYYFSFYDYDPVGSNEFMGDVAFKASDYTTNYETSPRIIGSHLISITLGLQWY